MNTYGIKCKITAQTYFERKVIDLTSAVKTLKCRKGLYDVAGSWQLSLLPARDKNGLSYYHRLQPMDYFEFRFTRDYRYAEPPIVMRGFTDHINMATGVDREGKPQRAYNVNGQDYGKVLDMAHIYYLKELQDDLVKIIGLPSFEKLQQKYGVNCDTEEPSVIIGELLKPAQAQLDNIQQFYTIAPDFTYLGSENIYGRVAKFFLTTDDGTVWEIMQTLSNNPWNELYVSDFESGPTLVFRQAPFKDPFSGSLVQGSDSTYEKTLKTIAITPDDIKNVDLNRSDAEAKNYFFTNPIHNMFGNDIPYRCHALLSAQTINDLKSNPYAIDVNDRDAGLNRFGFRRYEMRSNYITVNDEEIGTSETLAKELNRRIKEAYKYNSAFESGMLVLKGNTEIKPGYYLQLDTGYGSAVKPEYYVTSVEHSLSLEEKAESFDTTVEVVRGTGWLQTRQLVRGAEAEQLRHLSGRY